MSTPLMKKKADGTPYFSRTEWEFENALHGNRPVLLYRRSDDVLFNPRDPLFQSKLTQLRRVDEFFARFTEKGGASLRAHAGYANTGELLTRVRQDVEHYLSELLGDRMTVKVPASGKSAESHRQRKPATGRRASRHL